MLQPKTDVLDMKKIYIIEDEKDISNLYKIFFEKEGIKVEDIIISGKIALDKIEQIKEFEHLVFIIDNRIPDTTGLEIAQRLIEKEPSLKEQIIFATADDSITKKDVTKIGIEHFLRKPFSLDDLLKTIEQIENIKKE